MYKFNAVDRSFNRKSREPLENSVMPTNNGV
jgi:hypothetical protein